MEIEYKCKIEVLSNVWHHNLLIDKKKMHLKENSEVPMSEKEVIDGILSGILYPQKFWLFECS
jgi:hypothetical protein